MGWGSFGVRGCMRFRWGSVDRWFQVLYNAPLFFCRFPFFFFFLIALSQF